MEFAFILTSPSLRECELKERQCSLVLSDPTTKKNSSLRLTQIKGMISRSVHIVIALAAPWDLNECHCPISMNAYHCLM